MPNTIKLLPESLANQIAAGEVIQRPASVIKELVENAVDAGAQHIKLILKNAGKTLIQVIDDGSGMNAADARMSFERHATSKISNSEQLFHLSTKGFRGEALASIAAIAQVELKTKPHGEELGHCIQVSGSKIDKSEVCQCPAGSSFSVRNLFFNVPARRKFLKSDATELKYALEEFIRIALAHPDLQFVCYHNDKEIYHLKPGKLSLRVVSIFGKTYQDRLIPVDEHTEQIGLQGYIGKPEYAKKSRGEQYFFVNQRFIKSNYLNHAVKMAYEELILKDQFPFFVLFITIDTTEVDINVHPTKQEVKFEEERLVYNYIKTFIKRALGKHSVLPKLDFQTDINNEFAVKNTKFPENQLVKRQSLGHHNTDQVTRKEAAQWRETYESLINTKSTTIQSEDTHQNNEIRFESTINNAAITDSTQEKKPLQINQSLIVSPVKSGLLIVNQQAAHERILYERYIKQLAGNPRSVQRELFPQKLELSPTQKAVFDELYPLLNKMGFLIEPFGGSTYVVQGLPAGQKKSIDIQKFVDNFVSEFERENLSDALEKKLAKQYATFSAIKLGEPLDQSEMQELIGQLFACETPYVSPRGIKTFTIKSTEDLIDLIQQ